MRVAKKRASCAAIDASLSKTGFVLFALLARRLLLVGILEEILGAGCQESSEKGLILLVEQSQSAVGFPAAGGSDEEIPTVRDRRNGFLVARDR